MSRLLKYKPEMCDTADAILGQGKSLAAVCAKLDINRSTLYEWRDTYPEFKQAIESGLQKCQAYWEDLGYDGISGEIKGFGAAPWIFTMKNRFRDDYAEEKEQKSVSDSIVEKLIDRLVE